MTGARKNLGSSSAQPRRPAAPLPEPDPTGPQSPTRPNASGHGSASESWRELVRRIQNETDPGVMIELTHELIAKLDAEKSRKLSRDKS